MRSNFINGLSEEKTLLVGLGLINLDYLAFVPTWEPDQKVVATHWLEQVGGPVPVALATAVRLGLPSGVTGAEFVGVVGTDAAGETVVWELANFGVETSFVKRVRGGATSRSVVLVDGRNNTRTVANYAGYLPPVEFTEALRRRLHKARILHIDGRDTVVCRTAAETVREAGGTVSLDLGTFREGTAELLPWCDIVLASRRGGEGAYPECAGDPMAQTRRFIETGAQVAGVTLGAEGLVIGSQNVAPLHLSAVAVPDVRDTCGAGDVFHGAFLCAYLGGVNLRECARFAQAAVAERIRHRGNAAGIPTRETVEPSL